MKVLSAALATSLLAAAAAQAAPPWTEPEHASPPVDAGAARIAFDADGASILTYGTEAGTTRVVTSGGERELRGGPTALVRNGDRSFLLAHRDRRRVRLTRLTAERAVTRRVVRLAAHHALAANQRGRGVVAWIDARRPQATAVRVRRVRPAGRLTRAVTLATAARVVDVEVAVGPRGQTAVVWGERGRVRARVAPPRTRRFLPAFTVGRHRGTASIEAAFLDGGRLLVAWSSQDFGEEANRPLEIRAAAASSRFVLRRELVDRSDLLERPATTPRLEATPDGGATVAYNMPGGRGIVRTATAGPRGRFAIPATLAADAVLGDLAQSPTGTLLATWARADANFAWTAVEAAIKPLGQGFAAPEEIDAGEHVTLPSAAFDPTTGRPTAVWTAAPEPAAPFRVLTSERR